MFTTCTMVERPKLPVPSQPLLNASCSFRDMAAGPVSAKAKVPVTAHSPGSAARGNTFTSEGSRRMVRGNFMTRGYTPSKAE